MTDEFDNELKQLYQQRKSQLRVPDIELDVREKTVNRPRVNPLAILFFGSVASFGIMAIISHLAKAPEAPVIVSGVKHNVELADIKPEAQEADSIVIPPSLPEKPVIDVSTKQPSLMKPVEPNFDLDAQVQIKSSVVQVLDLPRINKPQAEIAPVFKVMPEYSLQAQRNKQSGKIKLRYQINELGSVVNIKVLESEVNRELQRSSRGALAKWRYDPKDVIDKDYEVIFDFKLAANK